MCAVSMVINDWERGPNKLDWPRITPPIATDMLEVLRRLDAIDRKLGALDCKVEEVAKRKFIRKLKRRAAKK